MESIAVLLPVLNEVESITELLQQLIAALAGYAFRIVIIDDGSKDGTIDKIEQLAQLTPGKIVLLKRIKTGPGCVRGEALVYGLNYAVKEFNPDIFIELDGDLSHQPVEAARGLALIKNGADVALGSKYLADSRVNERSVVRRLISYFDSLLLRLLIDKSITDYSNGYRIYNRKAAEVILNTKIKYGSPIYLAEALVLWKTKGLRIAEFAITYTGRKKGSSKVILSDVFEGLNGALDIAFGYKSNKK